MRDLLPEGVEVLGRQPTLQVCAGVDAWRRVALDVDMIPAAGMIFATEEVVEAHLIQAGRALIGRDVTANLQALAVRLADHDRCIPADESPNPSFDVFIAWEPRL
jgi:hypothetical protein